MQPLEAIEKCASRPGDNNERFAPPKLGQDNTQAASFGDGFRAWCREVNDFRTSIREILQNPNTYSEEMNFLTSLRQFQGSIPINDVQGGKVARAGNKL